MYDDGEKVCGKHRVSMLLIGKVKVCKYLLETKIGSQKAYNTVIEKAEKSD